MAAAAKRAKLAKELKVEMAVTPALLVPSKLLPAWEGTRFSLSPPLLEPGVFGEIGTSPIAKEMFLGPPIYAQFCLAGALGCAFTHLTVVPIDVVKTRLQTRPGRYAGFGDAFSDIRKTEGLSMLFQGAIPTFGGFFMYGAIVYPGYEILKRYFFAQVGPAAAIEWRVPLVLAAGAISTVLVSFVLTPFEAVRIRMVESPSFAPGPLAALQRYVAEGGVGSLYAGLLPLMVRQVSFGMVKFLVFDFAKEILFGFLPPGSSDDVAISLAISLLSGAIAGVAASIVSQPADVLLSKVAQSEVEGSQLEQLMREARTLWGELGLGGFFLGLGSRCLFAASIIAGQFFLYDAFREAFKVTASDLTLFYDALGAVLATSQLGGAA